MSAHSWVEHSVTTAFALAEPLIPLRSLVTGQSGRSCCFAAKRHLMMLQTENESRKAGEVGGARRPVTLSW